ncbi:hypothetical protein IT396_02210 [Candidatus Nomurabacteria bacterium]|nr:hypothetical protein [Candidatus Nomurabacteria bacterium]
MQGEIDGETNLPVLKLMINQREIPCLVDTGFNGYLWTDTIVAQRLLGVQIEHRVDGNSQVADGALAQFELTTVEVSWFSRLLYPSMQVVFTVRQSRFPVVLGTRMLLGYILIADFNHGIVQIKDPSVSRVSP